MPIKLLRKKNNLDRFTEGYWFDLVTETSELYGLTISEAELLQFQAAISEALGDGWISVDDPPKYNRARKENPQKKCMTGVIISRRIGVSEALYEDNKWWYMNEEVYPTHWQPLPKPPVKPVCPHCGNTGLTPESPGSMVVEPLVTCECQEKSK